VCDLDLKTDQDRAGLYLLYAPFTPPLRLLPRNGRVAIPSATIPLLSIGLFDRLTIKALEILFIVGMLGSALVVVITFVEDLKEVFSTDEPPQVSERRVSTEHIHA
jgi:hypothetical protein